MIPGPNSDFPLALVVAILVSLYADFNGHAASDAGKLEKTEIVLAYPQASGVFTPIFVAGEAGLFKKYGLNVKLQQLNPQSSVQAVVSGSADMSVAAGDLVNASLQGAKIKLVGSSMSQLVFQLWAAKRNHRRSPAQGQNSRRHDAAFRA